MVDIIRPTLLLEKDICLQNIERMAQKAADHHLRFRPHFKTHQSAEIAGWFKNFGVNAITVSSVTMAEYFASNGWNDITVAFPVNILEIKNINSLAAGIRLNVTVENTEAATILANKISHPLGIYIKIDTGYHRTGIAASKTSQINAILKITGTNSNLNFLGFLSHTGHTYHAKSINEIFSRHFDALLKLRALKDRYIKDYPNLEISMGDTPSATVCTNFEGIDEFRPGNFVFYDLMMQNLGVCRFEDIAVKMVCPVVAKHSSRNEIVIYGGAVHFSKESIINVNGKALFGRIIIRKNGEKILLDASNYLSRLSQEHGVIKVTQSQFGNFQIGDLVEIIPVHSCLTANLSRNYITTEGQEIRTINS